MFLFPFGFKRNRICRLTREGALSVYVSKASTRTEVDHTCGVWLEARKDSETSHITL